MKQTEAIHGALKKALKTRGRTYADAAGALGLSEASVKRLFSQNALSLSRLETICDWLGIDVDEVVRLSREQKPLVTQLTAQQEVQLLKDKGTLLVAYLLLNHWEVTDILTTFRFTQAELNRHMFALQRLGMLEVLPFDRVRLLTARNFSWRGNGPIQKFFKENILAEFLDSRFDQNGEAMHFVSGMLTRKSIHHLQDLMSNLIREFDRLVEADLGIPVAERFGTSLFTGMRPWEYSEFTELRRSLALKEF